MSVTHRSKCPLVRSVAVGYHFKAADSHPSFNSEASTESERSASARTLQIDLDRERPSPTRQCQIRQQWLEVKIVCNLFNLTISPHPFQG